MIIRKKFKNLIIICVGLISLVATLIINNYYDNDLLCIILMILFLIIELYGLVNIIKDKQVYRWLNVY